MLANVAMLINLIGLTFHGVFRIILIFSIRELYDEVLVGFKTNYR